MHRNLGFFLELTLQMTVGNMNFLSINGYGENELPKGSKTKLNPSDHT